MPSVGGIPLKYISLIVLAVQNSCLIIVMALAQGVGRKPFYSSTAVFINEIVKLIVCTGMTIHGTIKDTGRFYPQDFLNEVFGGDAWKLAIPAMLYAVQNNLQYVASHALDPSTFQVTYQLKILTAAIFSVLLLNRSLPALKWMSLVMLTAGIALVSLEESNNRANKDLNTDPESTSSALGALLEEQKLDTLEVIATAPTNDRPEFIIGLLAVLIACVLSGLAGVYFEKILKNTQESIWLRNIQLSFFSLPFSLLAIYLKDGEGVTEQGFFAGYDMLVIAAIACQSAGGLIVAVVVKYADNILKSFATSVSIVISAIASVALFGSRIGTIFVLGTSLVLGATYLYSLPDKPVVKYVDLGSQLDTFHAEEGRVGSPGQGSNDSPTATNSPSFTKMPSSPVRPLANHLVINTHNLSQAHNRGSPRSASASGAMTFKDSNRQPSEKRHSSLGPGHGHLGHGHPRPRQSLMLTLLRIIRLLDSSHVGKYLIMNLQHSGSMSWNSPCGCGLSMYWAFLLTTACTIVTSRPVTEPTRAWVFITFIQSLLLLVIVYLPWFKSQMAAIGFPALSERLTSHALEDGFMGREINGHSATKFLVLPLAVVGLCSWMLIITRNNNGYLLNSGQGGGIQVPSRNGYSSVNLAGAFLTEDERLHDGRMVISMIVLSSATPQGFHNRQLFRNTTLRLLPSPRNKAVIVRYRFIVGTSTPAIEREVLHEHEMMGDLLIVSTPDRPDNKSQKLYKAIEWANSFDFDYLVKTEDDVLVRMDTLSGELYKQGKKPYFWKGLVFKNVPNTNLDDMDLKEMPVFTDGTLTTISRDIVRLLATPAPRYFVASSAQSLGIWLHGYGIKPQHDTRIQPGAFVCEEDLIAKHFDNEPSLLSLPRDDPIKMVERINLIRAELKANKNNRNFQTSISICDSLIQKRCAMCYSCQGRASNWKLMGFDCKQGGVVVGDKYRKPDLFDAQQMDELLNRPSTGVNANLGPILLKDYRQRQQIQSPIQGNAQPINEEDTGAEAGTGVEESVAIEENQEHVGSSQEEEEEEEEERNNEEGTVDEAGVNEEPLDAQDEEGTLDEEEEQTQEEQDGTGHGAHDESEIAISDQEVDYLDRRHDEELPPTLQGKKTQRKKPQQK
ncbi:hypothetical protein BGZ49_007841 [Haplosporangium sp. Z 27]|nr:hypothetical protein BGZ49_007841 [Haplosporangium sp. Z 27]